MSPRPRANRTARDAGQAAIAMLVAAVALFAAILEISQVGQADDLSTRSQTASDAAALASAKDLRTQLLAALRVGVLPQDFTANLDDGVAAQYAADNDASLDSPPTLSVSPAAFGVHVITISNHDVHGLATSGERARNQATAEVQLLAQCSYDARQEPAPVPSPAPTPTPTDTPTPAPSPTPPPPPPPPPPPISYRELVCDGRDVLHIDAGAVVDLTPFIPLRVRLTS